LVLQSTKYCVLGYEVDGQLGTISINGLRTNAAKATTEIEIAGNLSSTVTEATVENVQNLDGQGADHWVRLLFTRDATDPIEAWNVAVIEGTTTLHEATVQFTDGYPDASANSFSFTYTPSNATPQTVNFILGPNTTSFASGDFSTLVVSKQDGYEAGDLTQISFNESGTLQLTYSNGKQASGSQLAIATFDDQQTLEQLAGGLFSSTNQSAAHLDRAGVGGRGQISAGQVELSNVDLASEFSQLIVMQRGYQASSRIVSTANEMLQELLNMKGNR
jgi:flagellar hook protein FlgE